MDRPWDQHDIVGRVTPRQLVWSDARGLHGERQGTLSTPPQYQAGSRVGKTNYPPSPWLDKASSLEPEFNHIYDRLCLPSL